MTVLEKANRQEGLFLNEGNCFGPVPTSYIGKINGSQHEAKRQIASNKSKTQQT